MSQTSQSLGMPIPEPHVDTWNESMGMVTEALESIDEFAGDTETATDNLESSIAYVESVNAKTNHAVDDYFMLGNVLMRATAAIATGEQITASNAVPATLQSQIDTLRDSVSLSLSSEHTDFCRLTTYGRIAVITARSFTSLQPQAYTNIATIPQAYRPAYDSFTIVPNYNMDHALVFRVDASGSFRVYNYGTTSSQIENTYISLLWVIG